MGRWDEAVRYLNEKHIRELGVQWPTLADVVSHACAVLDSGDYAQPVKPYLRYRDPVNRIIAMPAFLGGSVHAAGLKWIASFPENRSAGLPRAHSVTIVNDADTGVPVAVVNTALVSGLRTAAVSALMLRHYAAARPASSPMRIGLIGFGPIGRLHAEMCFHLLGHRMDGLHVFDIQEIDVESIPASYRGRVRIAQRWEEAYLDSDLVMTCTVSDSRYIDREPKPGALLLHVSLRDYQPSALASVRAIVVDDWQEVCRENTDIEVLHRTRGLLPAQTRSMIDVACRGALSSFDADEAILFCPMGLAAFDIAVAAHYVRLAEQQGVGVLLE